MFVLLCRLVKHARRVIVSDALINDNTFEFLKNRRPESTIMLTNTFQKFQNVPAVRLRNELEFLEKLVERCNANQPFLFGSDSCDVVTKFYHRCLSLLTVPALRSKFLLITAETDARIKNASEEFRDKFVFFSPKITFGVDFSVDLPQDAFMYIRGNSISPAGMFQQATRTRNIRTLFFHGECGNQESQFENLEDVQRSVETSLAVSKDLAATCTYVDEFDQLQFVHNTFFKMFCYTEFVNDLFSTSKVKHFEHLLQQNGFSLSTEGAPEALSKAEKATQRDIVDRIAEELFDELLQTDNPLQPKFNNILKQADYLNLPWGATDRATLEKFRETLVSKHRAQEHDAIIRLLKSNDHVNDHLAELSARSIDAKLLTNSFQKTKIIQEFDAKFGINLFNLGSFTGGDEGPSGQPTMDEGFFKLVKQAFRVKRGKPASRDEIKQLFVSIVKTTTCKDIIKSTQGKSSKDRDKTVYHLNENLLKHHLELNGFKNKTRRGFAPEVVEKFGLEAAAEETDDFLDDERENVEALDA